MRNVLVVEDCLELQIFLKASIGEKYQLFTAGSVSEALSVIAHNAIDLALIDVGLPDGDGFHLCSQLKNSDTTASIPVIFLTSKSDLEDKLTGFSLGAEDYIVKPVDPRELRARIGVKLDHRNSSGDPQVIRKGQIVIHVPYLKGFLVGANHEQELDLTPNEFRLLYYFMVHDGHVLSRTRLLDAIWGKNAGVVDRTIDAHIYSLRKKLGVHSSCIESVFGAGYRFLSDPKGALSKNDLAPQV